MCLCWGSHWEKCCSGFIILPLFVHNISLMNLTSRRLLWKPYADMTFRVDQFNFTIPPFLALEFLLGGTKCLVGALSSHYMMIHFNSFHICIHFSSVTALHMTFQMSFGINCTYSFSLFFLTFLSLPLPSPFNPSNLISLSSLYNILFPFPLKISSSPLVSHYLLKL